jgi:putative flippase GtrA
VTAFVRFNIVGAIGFLVQLGVLISLHAAGWPVAAATIVAVEAAILHNFFWHEQWTWARMKAGTRAGRLARFHLSNGMISMAGNAVLTAVLVEAGAPLVAANVTAVVACSSLNFAAAHLWVFCAKTWPTLHGHLQ